MSISQRTYLIQAANKVPEVTIAFWLIKILSTTVGETGADYLAVNVGLGMFITAGARQTLMKDERQRFLDDEWPRIFAKIQRLGLSELELLPSGGTESQ